MIAIPKIKINDKATWINPVSKTIAVSVDNLLRYNKMFTKNEYFRDKQIILLSIIPDDFERDYFSLLETLETKSIDLSKFILTTADCACYNDRPEWCDEELEYLFTENESVFTYKPVIGILKGYNSRSYERVRATLEKQVQSYLLYISGEARSNPRYFDLSKFISTKFPDGLDKPVYLHGCPLKQVKQVPDLTIDVIGIITANHITKAIYGSNPRYKRQTRIIKAWNIIEQAITG